MTARNLPPGVAAGTSVEKPRDFWPVSANPEFLVGKLDRVDGAKRYTDMARFPAAFRFTPGWEYVAGPEVRTVGISAYLEGRINAADSGKYFVIEFAGLGEAEGAQNAPKLFGGVTVYQPGSAEEKTLREFLHRTTLAQSGTAPTREDKRVAADPQAPLGFDDFPAAGSGDDLPF